MQIIKNKWFNLITISIFIICSMFFSCRKEIEFKGEETEPKIVINSLISNEANILVHVSKSIFFLNNKNNLEGIENAEVNLFVNGELVELIPHSRDGIYQSSYQPKIGDKIKISAQCESLGTAWSEEAVPPIVPILKVDTTFVMGEYYGNNKVAFKLHFNDSGDEINYYRLVVYQESIWQHNESIIKDYNFSFDDIVSGKNANDIFAGDENEFNIFTNELFSGKQYNLSFSIDHLSGNTTVVIKLQRLSKSYYLYLKSLSANRNSDNFFSEPVQIFNNINDGIGILGGYSSDSTRIYFDTIGFYKK